MMMKRRTLRVTQGTCFAWLAAGIQLACSESPPSADEGTGGTVASGGVVASSGGSLSSSGGKADTSSGGQASGGAGGATPSGPCDDPALESPCNEDDLQGSWLECKQYTTIHFTFPLSEVTAPAEGLRIVLLPLDSSAGIGGMGGSSALLEESLELLEQASSPPSAVEIHGETFDLLESAEGVDVSLDVSDGNPPEYIELHELSQYPWGRAQVALVQGDTILIEHRLLIDGTVVCLI